jgi:hypothetical protein
MQFALLSALSLATAAAATHVVCDSVLFHGFVKFNSLFQKNVKVGGTSTSSGGIFQFTPPTINATKGTVVSFLFSGV